MTRRILKLALFLFLGAMVNVAVAWYCGWRSVPDPGAVIYGTSTRSKVPRPSRPVHLWRLKGRGVEYVHLFASDWSDWGSHYQPLEDVWPAWVSLEVLRPPAQANELSACDALAQGWPMLLLRCHMPDYNTVEGGILLSREAVPGSFFVMEHVLAFRPIWLGLIANTALYSAMLWLLFAAPGSMQRFVRRRCGRCVHCGYDLRGSPSGICPECFTHSQPRRGDGM